jgi:hypothetical protein
MYNVNNLSFSILPLATIENRGTVGEAKDHRNNEGTHMPGKPTREVINNFMMAAMGGTIPLDILDPTSGCRPPANNPKILDLYTPAMEVQVNVSAHGAEPVEGARNKWTKDGSTFWHIRVPKNAMSEPHWQDYNLSWSLVQHADAVGMTGWDWQNRCSRWVAFDFDAITGHAPGVGVTDEKLAEVQTAATSIPWVQTRRSTRGGGIHIYVFFGPDGVPTDNHTVHSALARCILSKMSQEAGFNFASAIDVCGSNMWVWHRDANEQNKGFQCLKDNTEELNEADLPTNWRDHIDVVTRRRTKIKIRGIPENEDGDFDSMASSRNIIPLDDTHKEIIEQLGSGEEPCTTLWVPEYNLLQTHTKGFQSLMENNPDDYIGFFETNSQGNNLAEPNCFAFPIPDGGFKVYCFGKGHKEHDSWEQDGVGYTTCYFNVRPDLESASLSSGGVEITNGYRFQSLRKAIRAAESLGADLSDVKAWVDVRDERDIDLQTVKTNGRLKIKMTKKEDDPNATETGWVSSKGGYWEKIFKVQTESRELKQIDCPEFDNMFRSMVTPGGEHAGWAIWDDAQTGWDMHPGNNIKLILQAEKYSKSEAEQIMGTILKRRWRLVNMPFKPEFPGNRQWNYKAPQLRYPPANLEDDELPTHPAWDSILDHIGSELDDVLKHHRWGSKNNIHTGRQYLQLWIACMLREPFEPLPYLFLYGDQNSGKSIFHEAIGKLITGGICNAKTPLTTTGDHNGELANSVLAVVEEVNMGHGHTGERALNRIKEWVTAELLAIRRMRTDTYLQLNTLHFVQCANSSDHCPVMPGDTRITMLYVPALSVDQEVPKMILKKQLEKEAPHFLRTLMDLEIPDTDGRLRIPVLQTHNKEMLEALNTTPLDRFLDEVYYKRGHKVLFSKFVTKFHESMPVEERAFWTSNRITRNLPSQKHPTGKWGGNGDTYIGNLSFEKHAEEDVELVLHNRRLRPKTDS